MPDTRCINYCSSLVNQNTNLTILQRLVNTEKKVALTDWLTKAHENAADWFQEISLVVNL